jgi:hypothetical protein
MDLNGPAAGVHPVAAAATPLAAGYDHAVLENDGPRAFGDRMGTPQSDERVLWKGRPQVSLLARSAFHARKAGLYMAALVVIALLLGKPEAAIVAGVLGVLLTALLHLLALASARSTLYILTDTRLIMRIGIGGGSTELVLVEAGAEGSRVPRILDWQSVPWGVVSLTDTVGRGEDSEAARLARYARMRAMVAESFAPFAARVAFAAQHPDIRLLGTSGTVTTLASLYLELPSYDRKAVDGLIVPAQEMRGISARLSVMTPFERATLPCIGQDRADLVVAGCAILEAILDLWPARRLGVADRGIREGILRSLMAAERQSDCAMKALHRQRSANGAGQARS